MKQIDKELISELFDKALVNPRLRIDLRTSSDDGGQRMLNALMPGTNVPIHRHPQSNENVILLCGKMVEVLYDNEGVETERIHLDPSLGIYGCVVPTDAWHTAEVLEPSVIYEARDGKYGQDSSETLEEYKRELIDSPMILRFMQTHLAISRRILSISLAWNVNLDQWIDYTFVCFSHAQCSYRRCREGYAGS